MEITAIVLEKMELVDGEGNLVRLHRDEAYFRVVESCSDRDRIEAATGLLRQHKRILGSPMVDQSGGLMVGYDTLEAIRMIAEDDLDLASALARDFVASVKLVTVIDTNEAATLIRAAYLSCQLTDEDKNQLIADEIKQDLAWIADHRAEIDSTNPGYQGQPIRPSANRIARRLGVTNKRVERIYVDSTYGLTEYAELPSLGADGRVQAGTGAPRGRTKKSLDTGFPENRHSI